MTVSYFAGRFTAVAGNVNTRHDNFIFVIINLHNGILSGAKNLDALLAWMRVYSRDPSRSLP